MTFDAKNFLIKIQKLCKQRHIRLTPQRLEVLELMLKYDRAISAYKLLNLFQKKYPDTKPLTIYRVLNFLLTQKFIHRIESINSFMLCKNELYLSHNFAFFICKHCKKVTEQTTKEIKEILQKIAQISGFIMFNNIIEAHGLCVQCTNVKHNSYKTTIKNKK